MDVRRLPTSTYMGAALAHLARARADLQEIVGVVRRHGVTYGDTPRGLFLRFLEANGGCDQVRLRKPTAQRLARRNRHSR
jgi:hypothetical protein